MTDTAEIHFCVGAAKGPGETPHEYTFVTPDADETVKNGEFVYYETLADGATRQIVGRVTQRRPIRLYPDVFMADPRVPPALVAGMLGHDAGQHELFEISVRILGYYDPGLGDFINPRLPPRSGRPIYLCPDALLAQILSKRRPGEPGGAHIGSLLSRRPDAVPIVIDAGAFTSTHLAIIASTGAGKSYLAGVLIEEMMKPQTRACILIIDPHAEYSTLQEMTNRPEFAEPRDGYRAGVRVFRPDQVKVRVNTLNIGDYRCLLPQLSEPQESVLWSVLDEMAHGRGRQWGLDDLMMAVRRKGYDEEDEEQTASKKAGKPIQGTVDALLRKLGGMKRSPIFSDSEQLPLSQLYQPGQCTILQLNEIDSHEQEVVVATLLRRLFQARIDAEKKRADENSPDYLPYPTFTLIEEAHHFAPASADAVTTYTLRRILAEGRKFGVAIGLISQRPGKLDADMLSQCMTQCIMRIINPVDQDKVAQSVESVGRDLLAELPALSKGQVIIAGAAVNTPVLCRVRRRITSHGAQDKNAPEEWYKFASSQTQRRRQRDYALPADLLDDSDDRDLLGVSDR